MTTKLAKCTSKGQITLPKKWREKFNTDNFVLKIDNAQILIKPINIKDFETEEIIFDADRDNKGKGISVNEMIKMLTRIQNEQD